MLRWVLGKEETKGISRTHQKLGVEQELIFKSSLLVLWGVGGVILNDS